MPDARIIEVTDALVSAINTAWTGQGADDAVSREYLAPVSVEDLDSLTGRKVYLFPGPYDSGLANRAEDEWAYTIGILVVERYESAGDPPKAWLDARVYFTEAIVGAAVDYSGRTLLAIGTRRLWTESVEVETYSLDTLNQKKLFWSELTVVLKENAAA